MLKLDVGVVTRFLSDVLPGRDCGLSKKWHCSKYFVFLVNFKTVKILRQCFSPLGGWRGTGGTRGPSGRSCYCWPQRKPLGNDTLTLSLSLQMVGLLYLWSDCFISTCRFVSVRGVYWWRCWWRAPLNIMEISSSGSRSKVKGSWQSGPTVRLMNVIFSLSFNECELFLPLSQSSKL